MTVVTLGGLTTRAGALVVVFRPEAAASARATTAKTTETNRIGRVGTPRWTFCRITTSIDLLSGLRILEPTAFCLLFQALDRDDPRVRRLGAGACAGRHIQRVPFNTAISRLCDATRLA
jgi:hypothetical protein